MKFKQEWPEELHEFLQEHMHTPFQWGRHDCIMMAVNWLERASGKRVFSAAYADAEGAARLLKREGGMVAAISKVLGEPREHTTEAQRGDIAVVECGGRLCAGIVNAQYVAGPGPKGLIYVERQHIQAAWRTQNG